MLSRATAIFNFLKGKKFLLLLDDLWGSLDLEEVGVPRPNKGTHVRPKQKIILTTCFSDICGKMQADKDVRIECLNEEDAWNLLKSKVAEATMSNNRIQVLARRLARECSGLPLALTTVGLTMSMKKTPMEWENAIGLLKKSSFPEILSKDDDLFPVLSISYDYLKDDRMKNCFLFCSLIPENIMVPSEYIIDWILHLPSLQKLYLYDCKGLEQMISEEATPSSLPSSSSANQQPTSQFSNLKFVLLDSLEEMTSICDDSLQFLSLARIGVFNCRKLKQLSMGLYTEGKDRDIHGEGQWWNSLEWTDESIKSLFSPLFIEHPDGSRPRPTHLHELL